MWCEPQDSDIADTLGLCIFGHSVTFTQRRLTAEAIHNAYGTENYEGYVSKIGVKTLRVEEEFNKDEGFNIGDDELPAFFQDKGPTTDGSQGTSNFSLIAQIHQRLDRLKLIYYKDDRFSEYPQACGSLHP